MELGLANSLFNHLTISLINMNLENPLHLLYITIPFDLPNMTIGFRQLVDRVSGRRTMQTLDFFLPKRTVRSSGVTNLNKTQKEDSEIENEIM